MSSSRRRKRKEQRLARREARKAIIDEKKQKPCTDCKVSYPPIAMDFDHVRDNKRANVSRMLLEDYCLEAILAEVDKCELVCANCHRLRTAKRASESAD